MVFFPASAFEPNVIWTRTVADLRHWCRQHGKSPKGNKEALVQTILGVSLPKPPSKEQQRQQMEEDDLKNWVAPEHGFALPPLEPFDYSSIGLAPNTIKLIDARVSFCFS